MRSLTLLFAVTVLTVSSSAQPSKASGSEAASLKFDLASYERARLVKLADAALSVEPKTITSAVNPRSPGGPHDFSSEGDYWWPDPKNPEGPYIRRDGMSNPENFIAHRQLLLDFATTVTTLEAAYKVTGEEKYAEGAVRHLRAWFVDPATRMNPDLQYAQSIKGVCTGRGTGIIDTVHFSEVALGVEALRPSKAFAKESEGIINWFRAYLEWIRTHPYGIEESKADNNHGTCWLLQATAFADLVGDTLVLEDCRHRFRDIILPGQMGQDGSFPRELARTKPYGYSIFNLDVMTSLAQALSTPTENFVTLKLPDGRNMVKGVEFLEPYLADKSKWPKAPDVMYWSDWPVRQPSLLFGALAAGRQDWLDLWKRLNPDPTVLEIRRNFPIRQPVLWVR
jgi:Alginate lyase